MTKLNGWKTGCALLVLCIARAIAAPAQTFQTLISFNGRDGAGPYFMSLVQATDGNLYGTTYTGGSATQGGVLFKVTPEGTLTKLHNFCSQPNCSDGWEPWSGLVLASDGFLYGTTTAGGFSDWGLPICVNYCDWSFYWCVGGCGTIYRIGPSGRFETVYRLNTFDGDDPMAPLVQTIDGTFYGIASGGGSNGGGTIFKISPSGALSKLYNFKSCGQLACGFDLGALVQGLDGDLYGTAFNDANGYGTIFRITPGELTTLYTFCSQPNCADGTGAQGLLLASDGNFYGTTSFGGADNCGYYPGGC